MSSRPGVGSRWRKLSGRVLWTRTRRLGYRDPCLQSCPREDGGQRFLFARLPGAVGILFVDISGVLGHGDRGDQEGVKATSHRGGQGGKPIKTSLATRYIETPLHKHNIMTFTSPRAGNGVSDHVREASVDSGTAGSGGWATSTWNRRRCGTQSRRRPASRAAKSLPSCHLASLEAESIYPRPGRRQRKVAAEADRVATHA